MTAVVIALAGVAGLWLVAVDARTDDTGIEAGVIFLIAAALAAVRPRAAIVIAFIVGAPAGALLGAYLGIIFRRSASSSSA